jgi:nucleoside-diphosphate-sugar epimerase
LSRVLVTGASGFIGWHCLQPLVDHGHEVHAVGHDRDADPLPGVTWHQADLLEAGAGEELVGSTRPTHLLHLAWYVTPGKVASSPVNYEWVSRSRELLQAFVDASGQRAVLCGSAFEYDWADGVCSEAATALRPTTVYGAAKAASFLLAESIARESGLSMAWMRPFFLYGPREHPNRLVASVITALLRGEPARTSHGRQQRDYLHVQDVANAMVAAVEGDITGAVNIGGGNAVALAEIVTRVAEIIGRPELLQIGALEARANDVPLVVADTGRVMGELGWAPGFDLDAGLRDTVAWYRAALTEGEMPA